MGFDINKKAKNNRSSSDLMDKIIQNRHSGVEEGWRVSSPFRPLPFFLFLLPVEIIVN